MKKKLETERIKDLQQQCNELSTELGELHAKMVDLKRQPEGVIAQHFIVETWENEGWKSDMAYSTIKEAFDALDELKAFDPDVKRRIIRIRSFMDVIVTSGKKGERHGTTHT